MNSTTTHPGDLGAAPPAPRVLSASASNAQPAHATEQGSTDAAGVIVNV